MIKLNSKISVVVPSKIGQKVVSELHDKFVTLALRKLSKYGGASAQKQEGTWIDDTSGELVREDNTVVYAYLNDASDDDLTYIREIADEIKQGMEQDAVLIEYNNDAYLV